MRRVVCAILFMATVLWLGNSYADDISPGKIRQGEYLDNLFKTSYNYSGDKDAKVVVYDFFDYNCDDCRAITPYVEGIAKDYKAKGVKVVYIDYPKLGKISTYAAKVALAASMQGKYNEVHNALMNSGKYYKTKDEVMDVIKDLHLDMKKLKKDMNSDEVNDTLLNNILIGTNQSIKYIPTFIIGYTKGDNKAYIFFDDASDKGGKIKEEINKYLKELKA